MVSSGVDKLDSLYPQRTAHSFRIENIRTTNFLLQFRWSHRTVAIPIRSPEESGGHATAAGIVVQRPDDLIQLETATVVSVEHVARHLRNAAIHVPGHILVSYELCG